MLNLDEIEIIQDMADMYRSEFGSDGRYDAVIAIIAILKREAAQQSVQRTAPKAGDEITADDEAPFF